MYALLIHSYIPDSTHRFYIRLFLFIITLYKEASNNREKRTTIVFFIIFLFFFCCCGAQLLGKWCFSVIVSSATLSHMRLEHEKSIAREWHRFSKKENILLTRRHDTNNGHAFQLQRNIHHHCDSHCVRRALFSIILYTMHTGNRLRFL